MIDTVVLMLTKDMYQITEPEKFTPSAHCDRMRTGEKSVISGKQRGLRYLKKISVNQKQEIFYMHSTLNIVQILKALEYYFFDI